MRLCAACLAACRQRALHLCSAADQLSPMLGFTIPEGVVRAACKHADLMLCWLQFIELCIVDRLWATAGCTFTGVT